VVEQTVKIPLADAYADLKTHFEQEGCKILFETVPTEIVVKQGSLWGIMPRSAKKIVSCTLTQTESGTKISCKSKLSRDWTYITVIGIILSAVIVGVCLWMSLDLTYFLDTSLTTTWSWIASVGGNIYYELGESFIGLTRMLAGFLTAIILAEVAILLFARSRIDTFIKEIVKST
jgi:hypothetical protein